MEGQRENSKPVIAVIGGTGKEGKGLAACWAKAGYPIVIGSRQIEKAQATAQELREQIEFQGKVDGLTNLEAAEAGEIVAVCVPFAAHAETIEAIKPYMQGKIVVDVTVPLVPPKVTRFQIPAGGSASLEAQKILGETVQVVTAFQNISYENLAKGQKVDCDVLVCSNSKSARKKVLELVKAAGLTGLDAGSLDNSVIVEGLTAILIGINIQYGINSAGIRITGLPRDESWLLL